MGSRTYNGSRYPGASDFLREFEFLKLFPVSFQAFSVDAFNPKRIGRAQ